MRHKNLLIVTVALIGATTAFSQTLNTLPSRVLGHPNNEQISNVVTNAPNLVEGREMYAPQGIALDTSATPPIVYVSDTHNNRVLAWKNATSFTNGQFADMVIGQNDPFSTFGQGPEGGTLLTGFAAPSGLAVSKTGDLYVVDAGNNRILRFPKPFSQNQLTSVNAGTAPQHAVMVGALPDLVIGQGSLSSHQPNYNGTTGLTAQGIFTAASSFNPIYQAGVAFDASGNLWFTDTGNQRVLRFPAGNIPAANVGSTVYGISADLVIGQPSLTSTNTTPLASLTNPMQIKNQFGVLASLGFDPSGRLFVVDDYGDNTTAVGRVLVFANPSSLPSGNGSADRVMGVVPTGEIGPTGLNLTGTAATTFVYQTWIAQPAGIFFIPSGSLAGSVGVVDTGFNRILIFPPYPQWPAESTQYSPQANAVVGQGGSFTTIYPNDAQSATIGGGTPPASAGSLSSPVAAAFLASTNELFVADTGNNRVAVLPMTGGSGTVFAAATRILGQDLADANSPNLIEGREFWFTSASVDAGIALDTSGTTPHLYVSDPNNNRVLGYYDARLVKAGVRADLVIGQKDFSHAWCNYNTGASNGIGGDPTAPTQTSLCVPVGLVVDSAGNLYVADSGNGRVLRFPAPFANYPKVATLEAADLVLGQQGFSAQVKQASSSQMSVPYGVAISGINGLVVSDAALNRVLYFPFDANHTFAALSDNGKAATVVYGQPDFVSKLPGMASGSFNGPLHVATDPNGQVYVADAGNNRVVIFNDPHSPFASNTPILSITGLNAPRGVWVDINGNIWIANTNSTSVYEYPEASDLYAGATPSLTVTAVTNTATLATDGFGALYLADETNRVTIYFPALQAMNGANFLADRSIAPATIASLCAAGSNCANQATAFQYTTAGGTIGCALANNTQIPVATVLGGCQVNFVNGNVSTPAPLFYTSPSQINFYVPLSAPTSGNANIEVVQQSTGQVLAAGLAAMSNTSPGIFQQSFSGSSRQAAVLNEDNSLNSASNPAQRGHIITIYATGYGPEVPGIPADGVPAPSSPLVVVPKGLTEVLIGTCLLSEGTAAPLNCPNQPGDVGTAGSVATNWIPFTGLAPGFVGEWQIDAQIPMAVVPNQAAIIKVLFNGIASSDPQPAYQTVIYVK
jgi:uncharacterized protein (TIGR03437 family)